MDLAGDNESRRFEAFKANARYVNEFNKKEGMTYELRLNQFADMTFEEFAVKYAGAKVDAAALSSVPEADEEELVSFAPTVWDWRHHGVVTPVKNQNPCGSCWAFSSVGTVESAYAIATKRLLRLSEQQVLDCSDAGDCNGGWPSKVLQDFAVKKGIALDQRGYPPYYPAYQAKKLQCRTVAGKPVVKINGFGAVPFSDEIALKQRVYKQPVSVLVKADGVYSGPCGASLNHAVMVVGYSVTRDNIKYWIVKNSWGTGWGERGYIRMKRDVTAKEDFCGIAMYGMYPIMKTVPISMVADE
uniref:Peptidase C1A papain C-terminal domain-containing protein n=1 Tax=Leersia perrieri TaxID=77586 RepID=A0A0D9XGV0_9ORYZ